MARLWDAESGKPLAVLEGHTKGVSSVSFSPDGQRLATASFGQTVQVWNVESGKQLAALRAHPSTLTSVCFSPNGGRVAAASVEGPVYLLLAWESPEDQQKRRRWWRKQQAAKTEKAGQWFAARFHLDQLLKDDPNNAEFVRRRDAAEAHLKAP